MRIHRDCRVAVVVPVEIISPSLSMFSGNRPLRNARDSFQQEVIAAAFFQADFSDRDAQRGGKIELFVVLNEPAALLQQGVYLLACELFWGRHLRISSGSAQT